MCPNFDSETVMAEEALQELQKSSNLLTEAAGQQVKGSTPSGSSGEFSDGVNLNTRVTSLKALKEKAPEVYDQMIEATMRNILHQIGGHQRRMKRAMAVYNRL